MKNLKDAEEGIRDWIKKDYIPNIKGKCDVYRLPKEIFEFKRLIGSDRFFELMREENHEKE